MNEKTAAAWEQFHTLIKKIKSYHEAVGLMHWDLRTGAPKKGAEGRSASIGVLMSEAFKLQTSVEMGELLDHLSSSEVFKELNDIQKRIITVSKEDYDLNTKIPPEKFKEYTELTALAETLWEDFKENNDFAGFEPYLTQIVEKTSEFIDYWGPKATRYDTLLHLYEPDMTVEKLDSVFSQLRDRLVPLVEQIQAANEKPNTEFLNQIYDKAQQEKFGLFILQQIGYDFEAGRVDESVHPFQITINRGDARITTSYMQDDVTFALFSSLHEGGHALYEQNISQGLADTPLAEGASMGIHESQSRLWENFIGRSLEFWTCYYDELQQHFPEQLKDVTVEQFYKAINKVENSLIRIQADELTYNLHIIIRYEIEKMLFNEGLSVSELPKVWNEKYNAYLGITPPNDSLGVLQDVHWSGGSFGYFPSYALGNMYAAQIMNTMRKELPDLDQLISQGKFEPIRSWLTEKIYQHGKALKPAEIIERVTGEELNPNYLADYLEAKYKPIYGIK